MSSPATSRSAPPRPPLYVPWILVRVLFFAVLAVWLLVGIVVARNIEHLGEDASGSVRCPDGSYPASTSDGQHECFSNGTAPAQGFTADEMTDHQRDEDR